jgi:acyl-coenzyme A thioesterase PaaI-like protein
MRPLPHTRSCFVCGEANAIGLNLRFETDGRIVQARFRPRPEHAGFRGVVHGGLIATVLDETMVWACAVPTRQFAFCAELCVRFRTPLRPDEEVLVSGELAANRKNRILDASAVMRTQAGVVIAEATGKYLPIKTPDVAEMMSDLVGDSRWLVSPGPLPTPAVNAVTKPAELS